jgi:hypothetical protein
VAEFGLDVGAMEGRDHIVSEHGIRDVWWCLVFDWCGEVCGLLRVVLLKSRCYCRCDHGCEVWCGLVVVCTSVGTSIGG